MSKLSKTDTDLIASVAKLKALEQKLGLYYTLRSAMGYRWCTWFWEIGSRGRGKSYSVVDTISSYSQRYGQENVKVYYFRISDLSVKMMLMSKGRKAIDSKLVRKYKMDLTTHGTTLYNHDKPFIDFYALVSAAKTGKGVAEYDPDFLGQRPINPKTGKPIKRFIFIVIDEFMMADGLEKKSVGSPVEQFKIFVENILRDQERLEYPAVKIFGCANSVSECNDFLAQLVGFIPEGVGRFKLKRKHAIVDNIPNSEAYIQKRKASIGADIMDYEDDANYTNVVKRDLETLKPKSMRLNKLTKIIKFSKQPRDWFCLWDDRVIKEYKGQTFSNGMVIPMKRYLDNTFNEEMVKTIFELYDARAFLYNDLISQARFAAKLKELKKQ